MRRPHHPAAALMPRMSPEDYAALRRDIEENGLLEPIGLLDGQVLDGRHRQDICLDLGIPLRTIELEGIASPTDWVFSHNFARRHLRTSQRALVAARLVESQLADEARERQGTRTDLGAALRGGAKAAEVAGERCGVSARSVESALKVLREGVDALVDLVESGAVAVSLAAQLAALPSESQEKALAGAAGLEGAQLRDHLQRMVAALRPVSPPEPQEDLPPAAEPTWETPAPEAHPLDRHQERIAQLSNEPADPFDAAPAGPRDPLADPVPGDVLFLHRSRRSDMVLEVLARLNVVITDPAIPASDRGPQRLYLAFDHESNRSVHFSADALEAAVGRGGGRVLVRWDEEAPPPAKPQEAPEFAQVHACRGWRWDPGLVEYPWAQTYPVYIPDVDGDGSDDTPAADPGSDGDSDDQPRQRSPRRERDAYYTPSALAEFLVDLLDLAPGTTVHEPHAGGGAFVEALKVAGAVVTSSDINPEVAELHDFTDPWPEGWERPEWIVGNPPYLTAEAHVRQALSVARVGVAFLLRAGFLESKERIPFWRAHPAFAVYFLSERPSFTGGGTDSTTYAWFIWRHDHAGPGFHGEVVSWRAEASAEAAK